MDQSAADERSCALENFPSTYIDASKLSDTLPSLSIDETADQDFLLKEHYEKMDRLRKENFDLKLKLYLLESNEKLTHDSELKFKVLSEFEKKNEEIKNLKDKVKKQNKENDELKKRLGGEGREEVDNAYHLENEQLKTKLAAAVQMCSELVLSMEQLIQLGKDTNGANRVDKDNVDMMNTSQVCLDKATRFLSDASFAQLDSSGILKSALNRKTTSSPAQAHRQGHEKRTANQNRGDPDDHQPRGDQEKILKEFMEIVGNLRSLIDDFRANRVTYKDFSSKLDGLFEALDKQYRFLEKLQLSRVESDSRLKSAERMLRNEAAFKERIKLDLARSMKKIEAIISKTKQTA